MNLLKNKQHTQTIKAKRLTECLFCKRMKETIKINTPNLNYNKVIKRNCKNIEAFKGFYECKFIIDKRKFITINTEICLECLPLKFAMKINLI